MTRIVTALVLLSVLWPIVEIGPAWGLLALTLVIVVVGVWEACRLLERLGERPFVWPAALAGAALCWSLSGIGPRFGVGLPLVAVTLVALALALARRGELAATSRAAVSTLFPVLYVGLLTGHVLLLRALPGGHGEDGRDLLYMLFVCVILGDTAAFYVGTAIGRHKLAPRVSPGKTWEGAVGGVLASIAGALLGHFWFYQRLPLGHAAVAGMLIGITAILGDLSESMLKRAAGVKDSSALLPGHGGVLDRIDSLLFAGPVLYYYYLAFLGGSP